MSATRVLLGKYPSVDALYGAARALQDAGHAALDFYSPYPLPDSDRVLRLKRSPIPLIAGVAATIGVITAVLMQWWMNDVDYAIQVGNRNAVPSPTWVPIMFELMVLLSAFGALFGMLHLNKLPRHHHPVFESEQFRTASLDKFWVSAETLDEAAVPALEEKLRAAGARRVHTVLESV